MPRPRRPKATRFPTLRVESLEDRTVPASAVVAIAADAGGGPRVTVLDRATGAVLQDFFAYEPTYTGGVRVALGDLNGDGTPDVVTATGPGGGPRVRVFDGKTGAVLKDFFAYEPAVNSGLNVAVGDVNGDKVPDIVVGADVGAGPRVRVFDGKSGAVLQDFFAFDPAVPGGVRVAAADVNGDGKADVVAGAGPGAGSGVNVFDGTNGNKLASLTAFPGFNGGVYVASADLNADGKADIVAGAGSGGGPQVNVFDGATDKLLSSFFAYDTSFTGGVRVAAIALDASGRPDIITAPGTGGSADVRLFNAPGGVTAALYSAFTQAFRGGAFVAASGLPAALTQATGGAVGNFFDTTATTAGTPLLTLQLKPVNIDLLGLHVQTNAITVTVSVQSGSGELLGNLLTVVSNLVNLPSVNTALNNVLGSVVDLLNSATLAIDQAVNPGDLSNADVATTPVLDAFVAPVHLNLLGALVDTSPIHLTITAESGPGLILGNVIADLANLFNPPLPNKLNLDFVNAQLQRLLNELNAQIPGIPAAPFTPATVSSGDASRILSLAVAPIDVNLLGLLLKTNEIHVNADAITGNGDLLGNVLTTLLNTLGATPQNLTDLSNNLSAILAKVIGVLNVTTLTLSEGAVGGLSQVLQTLALPDLVNTSGTPATAPVLNLTIASPDGTTPPVNVNLLGLNITTSNIQAQLTAQTGDGQVLGNLVYNVAHLLDPGGSINLLGILQQLGL